MILKNKKIAIIGGGLGGLLLARLLQMRGADVNLYERDFDRTVRQQGATLDLHETSGLAALKKAGLLEPFYSNYRPNAGKTRVVDKDAVIYFDDHLSEGKFNEQRPEIDRGPLRSLLIDSLDEGTILWDRQFVCMEKKGNGWEVHFKQGTAVYADIVIGADGANSKIRSYLTDTKPIYSGVTIVEGNINNAAQHAPTLWKLVRGGKVFALENKQSIILSAKGDGSLSFYTGFKVPENWVHYCGIDFNNIEEVFNWFSKDFSNWNDTWHELFASDDLWFVARPQYHFAANQDWHSQPNLTIIGDAAHRMPPYAGEGANMAFQDACELADCLTSNNFPDLLSAINYYEKNMLSRAADVTKNTLDATGILHSQEGLKWLVNIFSSI